MNVYRSDLLFIYHDDVCYVKFKSPSNTKLRNLHFNNNWPQRWARGTIRHKRCILIQIGSVFLRNNPNIGLSRSTNFVKHRVTYNFLTYTSSLISTGDHEIFSSIILENTNLTSLADESLLLHVVTNICC